MFVDNTIESKAKAKNTQKLCYIFYVHFESKW